MDKITYLDKTGQSPRKDRLNQWWDEDANEVKSVVNKVVDLVANKATTGEPKLDSLAEWANSPDTPHTTTISLASAVANGGNAAIYYKGAVLTKDSFTGATPLFFSGQNTLNELCLVFIIHDPVNNKFSVNIQTGYTGATTPTPTVDVPDAPTALTLTEGDTTPPVVNTPDAPTSLILTEGTTV